MGFSPGVRLAAFSSADTACLSPSTASTGERCASGNVNVPIPQKRSTIRFASPTAPVTRRTISASATGRRLQKRARRQHHVGRPEAHRRHRRLVERVPRQREPRPASAPAASRARYSRTSAGGSPGTSSMADIEPVRRQRDDEPPRRAPRHQRLGDAAQSGSALTMAEAVTGHSLRSTISTPFASWKPSTTPRAPSARARERPPAAAPQVRRRRRVRPVHRCRAQQRRQRPSPASRRGRRARAGAARRRPPQWVKCRHTGATRSGPASSRRRAGPRSPRTSALHQLAGQRKRHEHRAGHAVGDAVALGAETGDIERLGVTHRAARR